MLRLSTLLFSAFALTVAQSADAQVIQGRVVDRGTNRPIQHVSVMILSASDGSVLAGTMTGSNGRYELEAPGPGAYEFVAQQIGYELDRRPLVVREQGAVMPDVRLQQVSLALGGLDVTATRDLGSHPSDHGMPTVLDRSVLEGIARQGQSLIDAARDHLNVRIRTIAGTTCVEYVTSAPEAPYCASILVVVDGRVRTDAFAELRDRTVPDLESIEILPPALAIKEYASTKAGNGALVIWSRGSGPHAKSPNGGR